MSKRPSLAESMKSVRPSAPPVLHIDPTPATEERKPYHAATRAGMKRLTAVLSPEDHRRVKRLAVDTDRSIEDLMREALVDLLSKHNA